MSVSPDRPGLVHAGRIRVRYAEIDGQKIVFNSRYLEYADVAITDYWAAAGMAAAIGDIGWESNVRKAEVDYLRPFRLGDEIDLWCRMTGVGRSSFTQQVELTHADTGALHTIVTIVAVGVSLETGRPLPHEPRVRAFLEGLIPRP